MALEFCGYNDYPFNLIEYNGCLVVIPSTNPNKPYTVERQCFVPRTYSTLILQEDSRNYPKLGVMKFTDDNVEIVY